MNNFKSNPVELDTFTGAINFNSSMGFPAGFRPSIEWIEWQTPTTVGHTCAITDDDGQDVFTETATTANLSVIKYFYGNTVKNLKIAISGVASGKILIMLR